MSINSVLTVDIPLICVSIPLKVFSNTTLYRTAQLTFVDIFDKIYLWTLFHGLVDRKTPIVVVRILQF